MVGIYISIPKVPGTCAPRGGWGAQVTLLSEVAWLPCFGHPGCAVPVRGCSGFQQCLIVHGIARIAWDNASSWSPS